MKKSTKSVKKSLPQPARFNNPVCPPDKFSDEEACVIADVLWREVWNCKFRRIVGPETDTQAEVEWFEAHGKWLETVYDKLIQIMNEHLLTPDKSYAEDVKNKKVALEELKRKIYEENKQEPDDH